MPQETTRSGWSALPRRGRELLERRAVRLAAWVLVGLLGVLASLRASQEILRAPVPTPDNAVLNAGQDYRDALYYPLRELLAGGNPYDPAAMFSHWPVRQEFDLYAPLHLVLGLPYMALDYRTGLLTYSVVSLVALVAIGVISARTMALPGGWLAAALTGVMVIVAQFGKSAIFFGQINTLVGLGGVLALTQSGRRPGWAMAGLAVAWIKPQFGIPLTVLMLARGYRREALGGTLGAFLVSLPVVMLLLARQGLPEFVAVLGRNLDYARSTPYAAVDSMATARIDMAAVFYRVTGWLPPGAEWLVVFSVLALACWLLGGTPARRGLPLDGVELILASTATLVCMQHQQSESLITVPALVAALVALLAGRLGALHALATALLMVPALHIYQVEQFLITNVGARFDSLIEGISLNLAFILAVVIMLRRPARPEPAPGDTPQVARAA